MRSILSSLLAFSLILGGASAGRANSKKTEGEGGKGHSTSPHKRNSNGKRRNTNPHRNRSNAPSNAPTD